MARIDDLPVELINFVAGHIHHAGDLAAFSRTSRRFHHVVDIVLYKFVRGNIVTSSPQHPLRWAAEHGQAGTLRKVLAAGISPNATFNHNVDKATRDMQSFQIRVEAVDGKEIWDFPAVNVQEEWQPREDDVDDDGTAVLRRRPSPMETQYPLSQRGIDLVVVHDGDYFDGMYDPYPEDFQPWQGSDDEYYDDDGDDDHYSGESDHGDYIPQEYSALHLAARGGHNDIVEILLDHGAHIDASGLGLCNCQFEVPRICDRTMTARQSMETFRSSALHLAICHFQHETARLLLAQGASTGSIPDANSSPALETAAATGQTKLCRHLLDEGFVHNVENPDEEGVEMKYTPLYRACYNGHWNTTVPFLLERGANIDVRLHCLTVRMQTGDHTTHSTFLYEACDVGRYEDAIRLVNLGADVNRGLFRNGAQQEIPLHALCRPPMDLYCEPPANPPLKFSGRPDKIEDNRRKLIEVMMRNGADIEAKSGDHRQNTPLHIASRHGTISAIEALLQAGVNVQSLNSAGKTPLMEACSVETNDAHYCPPAPGSRDYLTAVKLLLDHGSRINTKDSFGNNALHLICGANNRCTQIPDQQKGLIRLLLDHGIRESDRNKAGRTPFMIAFEKGALRVCDILVRRGKACQTLRPEDLHSMMMSSIRDRPENPSAFSLLFDLDGKGHLYARSTYVMRMVEGGHVHLASFYMERKTPPLTASEKASLLQFATKKAHARLTKRMLDIKAPVNSPDQNGQTPLYIALNTFGPALGYIVERLLAAGADVHYKHPSGSQMTPLQKAIADRKQDAVDIMLRHKPLRDDPRAPRGIYLHTAARMSPSKRVFSSLIRAGAKVTEIDSEGDTPLSAFLQWVSSQPQWISHTAGIENIICSAIYCLWSRGVDINRQNRSGKSIASYLAGLRLYSGNNSARTRVAKELQRRINIVPLSGGKAGETTLQFIPEFTGLGISGAKSG